MVISLLRKVTTAIPLQNLWRRTTVDSSDDAVGQSMPTDTTSARQGNAGTAVQPPGRGRPRPTRLYRDQVVGVDRGTAQLTG